MKRKLLTLLVLLMTAATGAVAQNYKVSVKDGTEDAEKWTIAPPEATTTGVPQGTTVNATYGGTLKVKSVKAVKKAAPAPSYDNTLNINTYDPELNNWENVTVPTGKHWLIEGTGAPTYNQITIADGGTVTLSGVNMVGSSGKNIICEGDATIILADGTTNDLIKEYDYAPAGIEVGPAGKTLTIQGNTGVLNISGDNGAAIGAGGSSCGNIVIEGGIINATSGDGAAIGGAYNVACGNITISGGTVTATSTDPNSPGIGCYYGGSCGDITITDGVTSVTATKGSIYVPNSIGAGLNGSCGTITIGGTVYPDGISTSPYTYDPSAPAEPAAPTLAQTMTTAGMTVKVNYNYADEENYCLFLSNGNGTYTFQSGGGFAGGDGDCAKALVVEDGKLVFKQNYMDTIDDEWDNFGFSVTFNTSNNTYSEWKSKFAAELASFISVEVNGATIAVTAAQ